ncbi:hypothetical protein APUTEX25_004919 [Auxenochlorella protothecoides]|uniref:Uncharacterized protein n=1 Tax=Auxenochlorella protothecoides TaxID=3075 RepID=A0A3M7KSD0_AUXPR|nr:hypothetical protein APUTEX25_004919 [Auxenochlorella protothecoides]|eukprot:RMZ53431.1 hypothetical protein APUTEX25_004919 [Auxenochlorella protothecoides]
MASRGGVANSLWTEIGERYDQAQGSGAASTTPTEVQRVRDGDTGVEFIVQVAANLQHKARSSSATLSVGRPPPHNPFLPYEEALWVRHLSPTHTLLLNKFNVVPRHVLVVTREFAPQSGLLAEADLAATWEVLQAAPSPGALAFFNSGPDAGASQPHRHFQVVPLPLVPGTGPGPPMAGPVLRALGDGPGEARPMPTLPFRSWAARLGPGTNPPALHRLYLDLLAGGGVREGTDGLTPDHNLVLTTDYLHLAVRRRERAGPVACNALGFAGTFFVKSREALEHVRREGPMAVLAAVGVPWADPPA